MNKQEFIKTFPKYLTVKNNVLHFNNVNLLELAKEHGIDNHSIKIHCPDMIKEHIEDFKSIMHNTVKKINYDGKFEYAYASKVNYSKECLLEAYKYVDLVETSSPNDLLIYENLLLENTIKEPLKIICNGTKTPEYIEIINRICDNFPLVNIITTVECYSEFKLLVESGRKYNLGLRNQLKELNPATKKAKDRFGLNEKTINRILKELKTNENIVLKMVSYHYSHIQDLNEIWFGLLQGLLEKRYIPIKKEFPSLDTIDLGGGLPTKGYLGKEFDYNFFANRLMTTIQSTCQKHNTKCPTVIGEYGRYTVSDCQIVLAKVNYPQNYGNRNIWYNINTSLMVYMADSWSFRDDYMILPVNLYENDFVEAKVCGITCDPGDIYRYQQKNSTTPLPKIEQNQELYVAICLAGCYQNNVSGFGGAHHCLVPEGKQLLLTKENGKTKISCIKEAQTIKDIMKLLHY